MNTNRLTILLACALLAGCEREDPIKTYTAPKDPASPQATAIKGQPAGNISWTLPQGWTKAPPASMAHSTFATPDGLQVTVTDLPPQPILANINRWAGQVGLPAMTDADLPKVMTPIKIDGQDAHLVDLPGKENRMLAGIITGGGKMWFFKLLGPTEKIAPHKDAFDSFVKSVTFKPQPQANTSTPNTHDSVTATADSTPIPGVGSGRFAEGWQLDPTPRQMREATIIVTDGNAQGEIAVSRLGQAGFADVLGNINRWRGQVGLPKATDPGANPPTAISLSQGPGEIYDLSGPQDAGANRKRMLVAKVQLPGNPQLWFFRFIGPYDLVTKNKPAFETFVKSLKLEQ